MDWSLVVFVFHLADEVVETPWDSSREADMVRLTRLEKRDVSRWMAKYRGMG